MMTVATTEAESREWAERLTQKIQATIVSAREQLRTVEDLLREAQAGDAATILGYKSWTEYVSDIFSQTPLRLEREDRAEVAKVLSRYGMSTRAIAPMIGVNQTTVRRDLGEGDQVSPDGSPDVIGEVTGLDGKVYSKPEKVAEPEPEVVDKPVKARRTALSKAAREAAATLTAGLDLIESIMADDRYKANKDGVRQELSAVIARCDDVFGHLESEAEETEETA